MYKKIKTIALLSSISLLTGCEILQTSSNFSPQAEVEKKTPVYISDLGSHYQTPALTEVVGSMPVSSYYAFIDVSSNGIPSGTSTCNEQNKFFKGLKSFFSISDASEILITAKISSNQKTLLDNIPILFTAQYDKGPDGTPYCITKAFNGTLTSKFKVTPSTNIRIEYDLKIANTKDFNTATKIKNYSTQISELSTKNIIGNLTNIFNSLSNDVDKSFTSAFSSASKDTIISEFNTIAAIGKTRNDAFKINLSKSAKDKKSLLKNASIQIELNYLESLYGVPQVKNKNIFDYPQNPNEILAKIDSNHKVSISEVIENNMISGIDSDTLEILNEPKHRKKLANTCGKIDRYLSEKLDLTPTDSLVAKWAILKRYSTYNSNIKIRSDKCFTEDELLTLQTLNPNYLFLSKVQIDHLNSSEYVDDMLNNLSLAIVYGSINKSLDIDNFIFTINPKSLFEDDEIDFSTGTSTDQSDRFTVVGKAAFNELSKITTTASCGTRFSFSDNVRIAFLFKAKDKNKYYSATLTAKSATHKIQRIDIMDYEVISGINDITSHWPSNINLPRCKNRIEA
mgnify:CR=1 FL=1